MLHVVVEYWLLTEVWKISQGLAYIYEYPEKSHSLIPDQKQMRVQVIKVIIILKLWKQGKEVKEFGIQILLNFNRNWTSLTQLEILNLGPGFEILLIECRLVYSHVLRIVLAA